MFGASSKFPPDTPVRDRLQAQALVFGSATLLVVAVASAMALEGYMAWSTACIFLGVAALVLGGPLAWSLWRLAKTPAVLLDKPPRAAPHGLARLGPLAGWALIVAGLVFVVLYWAAGLDRLEHSPPPPVVHLSGEIGHLHGYSRTYGRGGHGPRIDLQFAGDSRWFHRECDWYCDAYAPLAGYFDHPWPVAEADVSGDQILGLKVAGRTYFTPAQEHERQIKASRLWLRIWIGPMVLLTLGLVLVWIRLPRVTPYAGPNSVDEAHARELVLKAMHGRRS
ncbi:hypothetical protein [Phenylobacterium sp.]|uniref:hypothetical protein n=1 Tax=Phenylobacterium sp. TaxID=1871053 RepID=UPI002DEFEEC9|nr:hypothetical protein [Phenylobacterium sp.]